MRVIDRYRKDDVTEIHSGVLLKADGGSEPLNRPVLIEHIMDVVVNTVPTMRLVCTPSDLIDLVVGRLLSEGVICGVDDIEEIYLCDQGLRATVQLTEARGDFTRERPQTVPSCCTGNRVYNNYFTNDERPDNVVPIEWDVEWVFSAARAFAEDSPLHRATVGTHSCYLVDHGNVVVCREDLGRHNAFDKAIGHALREGFDLRQMIVFSSGRLPVDMVMKAIRAGIPVLVTKAVPTDETIRLAKEFDLTLVCQARPDSAVMYNDSEASS